MTGGHQLTGPFEKEAAVPEEANDTRAEENEVGTDYRWASAELRDGALQFDHPDGLADALSDGFFFIRQPANLDLSAGDRFARRFYLPATDTESYRGFRRWTEKNIADRQGYFERADDQTEQFFLESAWWEQIFPEAVRVQAKAMRDYATDILVAVLAELGLPRTLRDQATGGAVTGTGAYHLTFNHFRSKVAGAWAQHPQGLWLGHPTALGRAWFGGAPEGSLAGPRPTTGHLHRQLRLRDGDSDPQL